MTTVEINENTKEGKAILEILNHFSKGKAVRIIKKTRTKTKEHPISKNLPNTETLKVFQENDKKDAKELKRYDNVEELFEDLGI